MATLGLGLSLSNYSPSIIDRDVQAFASESGATDLGALNDLVKYLKAESLYDNFVIYPMKSAQNAGSGSTVYSLGGLTTNDMGLANLPSWDTTGITFDGVNQAGSISDFLGSETITAFARASVPTPSYTSETLFAHADTNSLRSWFSSFSSTGGNGFAVARSSDGSVNSSMFDVYKDNSAHDTSDLTYVSQWIAGGSRATWRDKTSKSLSLAFGTPQTSRLNVAVDVTFAALLSTGSLSSFLSCEAAAFAVANTSITTAQREAITDFINAL